MKKIVMLAVSAILVANLSAQELKKECCKKISKEEKVELDIKRLTNELLLSDKQAEKFAATYREYAAKVDELFQQSFTAKEEKEKVLTEAELDKLAKQRFENFKNLADLQHEYSEFRIKAPLVTTEPLKAYVGMKEDITEKSRFEVLEVVQDEEGRTTYNRVGMIRPVKGKIWDNRYMADEEGSAEAKLDGTLFERVSGSDFQPGMLIRESK